MFGAFAAWGCACSRARRPRGRGRDRRLGVRAGVVLGYCVMLSYGLPLLGVLAVTILLFTRRWRRYRGRRQQALVVLAFAAAGFAWWDAYPVLVERYWAGVATNRAYTYWVWANIAALAFSAGPLVGAGIALA